MAENINFEEFVNNMEKTTVKSKSGIEVSALSGLKRLHDNGDLYDFTKALQPYLKEIIEKIRESKQKDSPQNSFRDKYKVNLNNSSDRGMFTPETQEKYANRANEDVGEVYR